MRIRTGRKQVIEEVVIQTPPDRARGTTVCVISGDAVLTYGSRLKDAEKEWVRDLIIAVISK